MARYALYVGIGNYREHHGLEGCVDDAQAMATALKRERKGDEGWPKPNTQTNLLLTQFGEEIDAATLARKIDWLLPPDHLSGHDVLFYFAGHGVDCDGELLLATSEDDESGVRSGYTVRSLITKIRESKCNSATIILDCCKAGIATWLDVPRNTVILAGTGARQTAIERGGRGVFTETMIPGIKGAAADIQGQVTAVSLYNYVAAALGHAKGQFPAIKANMDEPLVLKRGRPKIELKDLEKLPRLFSRPNLPRPVTPDHEASEDQSAPPPRSRPYPWPIDADGRDVPKTRPQREMDRFKRLRDAGLIEAFTPDEKKTDLFWACLATGYVKLTPLGAYYWQLAKEDQLT